MAYIEHDDQRQHIGKFYDFLNHRDHGVTELRIIINKKMERIGYFDNKEDFITACMAYNGNADIYASLNPAPKHFLSKSQNTIKRLCSAIKTEDMQWINNISIYIKLQSNGNPLSHDEGIRLAKEKADRIASYLIEKKLCKPEQVQLVMPGSGCQLLLPIPPIEITDDNRGEVIAKKRRFEQNIRELYQDVQTAIDPVYDLPRMVKVIGTTNYYVPENNGKFSYPFTDLIRYESNELREHIFDQDFFGVTKLSTPPKQDELPTDISLSNPCSMCLPAMKLWNEKDADDRSDALFYMMQILISKGIPFKEAVAYIQHYDRSTGAKYVSRNGGGLKEISKMYDKIVNWRHNVKMPCNWLMDNDYCSDEDHLKCIDACKKSQKYRTIALSEEEVKIKTISLGDARKILEEDINKIDISTKPMVHLMKYPAGIGKTTKIAEFIRKNKIKTLWLSPTHKLAQQTREDHFKNRRRSVVLKGRKYMIDHSELKCPNKDYILKDQESNLHRCKIRFESP